MAMNTKTFEVESGSPIKIMDISDLEGFITPDGRYFSGWSKTKNPSPYGTNTDYHAGDTEIITKNTTLYAVWKRIGNEDDMLDYKNAIYLRLEWGNMYDIKMPFDGRFVFPKKSELSGNTQENLVSQAIKSGTISNLNRFGTQDSSSAYTFEAFHGTDYYGNEFSYMDAQCGTVFRKLTTRDVILSQTNKTGVIPVYLIPYVGGKKDESHFSKFSISGNRSITANEIDKSLDNLEIIKVSDGKKKITINGTNWQKVKEFEDTVERTMLFVKVVYNYTGAGNSVIWFQTPSPFFSYSNYDEIDITETLSGEISDIYCISGICVRKKESVAKIR